MTLRYYEHLYSWNLNPSPTWLWYFMFFQQGHWAAAAEVREVSPSSASVPSKSPRESRFITEHPKGRDVSFAAAGGRRSLEVQGHDSTSWVTFVQTPPRREITAHESQTFWHHFIRAKFWLHLVFFWFCGEKTTKIWFIHFLNMVWNVLTRLSHPNKATPYFTASQVFKELLERIQS